MLNYYKVDLYPGCGVELKTGYYEADSPEDALVQASIQLPCCWQNFKDLKEEEILEFEERNDEFVFLDRSEYGEENGYLYIVNSRIEPANRYHRLHTKFGDIFIERQNPDFRDEEERYKIRDSKLGYLGFWYTDDVEGLGYDQFCEKIENAKTLIDLLNFVGVFFELITDDRNDVAKNLNIDPLDKYSIEHNEIVNIIGNTYIVVAE